MENRIKLPDYGDLFLNSLQALILAYNNQIYKFIGDDFDKFILFLFEDNSEALEFTLNNIGISGLLNEKIIEYPFVKSRYSELLISTYINLFQLKHAIEKYDCFQMENLNEVICAIVVCNNLISELNIQSDIDLYGDIDYTEIYTPGVDYYSYIQNMMKSERTMNMIHLKKGAILDEIKRIRKSIEQTDKERLENIYNFMCLQVILHTIKESSFYNDTVRDIAEKLLNELKNLLFNSEIRKIVIDPNLSLGGMNHGAKSTTGMKIYFSLYNLDRYCLRVDFPHDGAETFHLNLHEFGRSSGIPISSKQYLDLKERYPEYDLSKLFLDFNNQYWFKNNFIEKLNDFCDVDKDKYFIIELTKLFNAQAHFDLGCTEKREISNLLNEISISFFRLRLDEYKLQSTANEDIDISLKMIKIIDILSIYKWFYCELLVSQILEDLPDEIFREQEKSIKKDLLESVFTFDELLQYNSLSKEELLEFELSGVLDYLDQYYQTSLMEI